MTMATDMVSPPSKWQHPWDAAKNASVCRLTRSPAPSCSTSSSSSCPGSPSSAISSPRTSIYSTDDEDHELSCRRTSIDSSQFTLSLLITSSGNNSTPTTTTNDAPPAFFPLQRVTFTPRLRIPANAIVPLAHSFRSTSSSPLKLAHESHDDDDAEQEQISGLMLGVTGVVETLDPAKPGVVRARRLVADFCTNLSSGVSIWKRDAEAAIARKQRATSPTTAVATPSPSSNTLPPGTYVLPLSMRIPCSDKLPPSFICPYFRISYTMTLALLAQRPSTAGSLQQQPRIVKLATVPFDILPSTLPSPSPELPTLTHDERRHAGLLASIMRTAQEPTGAIHLVTPSLPTSHFTPGGIVPVTLRILTTTTVPRQHASATSPPVAVASNDLYVRLALVRKVYIRDATHAMAQEAEWNLTPADDDVVWERWCVSEEEVVSRWGWVRGEERGGATEVVMRDIALPLTSAWRHGYSTGLDLIPQPRPSLEPGSPSSFFAPVLEALAMAPARSHDRHLHVASRYFVSIEVGFHSNQVTDGGGSGGQRLADVLHHVPGLHIPPSSSFTAPVAGRRGPNPFPAPASSASLFGGGPQPGSGGAGNRRSSTLGASGHPMAMFPGKLRELLIPVTIGSVAEPSMECLTMRRTDAPTAFSPSANLGPSRPAADPSRLTGHVAPLRTGAEAERLARTAAAWREEIEETSAERVERVGDDGEEAWLCAPPCYQDSLKAAPAYV